MFKINVKSVLVDYAFVIGVALVSVTDDVVADSKKQPLPEVIEKESARERYVLTPDAPGTSTASKQLETDTNNTHASDVPQKESGQELFSDESSVEVRGILEQVSKEKETLPGIVSSGNLGGMAQSQPMYQPEGQ